MSRLGIDDLAGKRLGLVGGHAYPELQAVLASGKTERQNANSELANLERLLRGWIDATVVGMRTLDYQEHQQPGLRERIHVAEPVLYRYPRQLLVPARYEVAAGAGQRHRCPAQRPGMAEAAETLLPLGARHGALGRMPRPPPHECPTMNDVTLELLQTGPEQAELIRNLYQFYAYESSDWEEEDVEADGRFYIHEEHLARYWQEPQWSANLILVDGFIAGFLLIERSELPGIDALELADLFILKRYRRRGIGRLLATRC